MSRIEQLINEIEEYIDGCKPQPFNNKKIIVDKDEIEELLAELRLRTPDEIKKYQKIISNKDAILNSTQQEADILLARAKDQADSIVADARRESDVIIGEGHKRSEELISENEIMQQAYLQANEVIAQANAQAQQIVDDAVLDANNIRESAVRYTDEMLAGIQGVIGRCMEDSQRTFAAFEDILKATTDVVEGNRRELQGVPAQEDMYEEAAEPAAAEQEDVLSVEML